MPMQIKHPIVRIPDNIQMSIYLIKEELKSRKLFHALHDAGIDDCYFQPHLDILIIESLGLRDGTDETFKMYDEIMDRRSKKIEADNDAQPRCLGLWYINGRLMEPLIIWRVAQNLPILEDICNSPGSR